MTALRASGSALFVMSAARSRVLTFSCIFSPRHHIVDSELNPKNRRPAPGLISGLTFGAAHFYRTMPRDYLSSLGEDIGIARTLEIDYPGRTFVVIPVGRLDPPRGVTRGIDPDFQKFDRALKTQVRPLLVSLQRLPFRDFTAEEFLGCTLTTCRGAGGCVSVFQGSSLTLGQMADACVYVGGGADVDKKAKRLDFVSKLQD